MLSWVFKTLPYRLQIYCLKVDSDLPGIGFQLLCMGIQTRIPQVLLASVGISLM
jgi:hypothetical protein